MATWIQNTDVPIVFGSGVREQLLYNDKFYIVGGQGALSNKTISYDTTSNSYDTTLSDMDRRQNCAGAISGSTIFVFGGYGTMYTCVKYEILTDTWSSIHNMPAPKEYAGAARLGNFIYIFGSQHGNRILKYDIAGDTWTVQVQTYDGMNYSAVTVGNYIYIFGGDQHLNDVKKYDPINDVWITSPTLTPIPGTWFKNGNAFVHGTNVYLLGGIYAKTRFLQYDTVSNNWTTLPNIPYDKVAGTGGIPESGNIYIMGGGGYSNLEYSLIDPGDINPYKSRIQG